jgi:hypothetical protein
VNVFQAIEGPGFQVAYPIIRKIEPLQRAESGKAAALDYFDITVGEVQALETRQVLKITGCEDFRRGVGSQGLQVIRVDVSRIFEIVADRHRVFVEGTEAVDCVADYGEQ